MTADPKEIPSTLLHLGPGEGSKVEHIKVNSNYLRGQIAEELAEDTTHFSEEQVQLIKFHGMYQQEDRDVRQTRKGAGMEKAYQFMVRSRIPGGVLTAEQYLVEDDLAARYAFIDTMECCMYVPLENTVQLDHHAPGVPVARYSQGGYTCNTPSYQ